MKIRQIFFKKRSLILFSFIIIGYFLSRPAPSFKSEIESSAEIRGVWLTNVGTIFFHHTTLLDNIFAHLARSNYTHIYVSTYGFGGTIYPSQTVKTNPLFLPPFTDVLKASKIEAGRQGLKLYAWLEYGLMLSPTNFVAVNNPDWLLKTPEGKTVVNGFVWLNPDNPEVQEYILDIIEEVANYKELTGIQLDDHWGVPSQFGNYINEMNELTAQVKKSIDKINPNLIFSLSPNPYSFSKNKYNQDWLYWAKQGYIDEVIIQIYRDNSKEFEQAIITSEIDKLDESIPVAIGIYAGSFDSYKHPAEIQKQIDITQNLGYGFSIFCWEARAMGADFFRDK
ncbi:MAG: family 10 glycosylhydrolase [Cyanobacterium sp. T60_A2020_053]|nr:family 10 glycosylhydrolase [Cyanobacterium sp. T60_A2020_053]